MNCPICFENSSFVGLVDFNKSAADLFEGQRVFLEPGLPIPYSQCCACGYLYSDYFQHWPKAAFEKFIYNEHYPLVDPPFLGERPQQNADWIIRSLETVGRKNADIFDYGAGAGCLIGLLEKAGFGNVAGIDEYQNFEHGNQHGKYEVVTCFEVIEHVLDPHPLLEICLARLKHDGVFIFSTVLQPTNQNNELLNWWYLAPRNGHIGVHSKESLIRATPAGYVCHCSIDRDIHAIVKQGPQPILLEAFLKTPRPKYQPE